MCKLIHLEFSLKGLRVSQFSSDLFDLESCLNRPIGELLPKGLKLAPRGEDTLFALT
jgi:hypothetical protein